MKRTLQIFLVMLAIASLVGAQETWRGLRFGMTEAEVKAAAPAARVERLESPGPGALPFAYSMTAMKMPTTIEDVFGNARLLFDKRTHRLAAISIILEMDGMATRDRASAVKRILEALENKYGEPFRTEKEIMGPAFAWRSKGQIIEFTTLGEDVAIRYAPLTNEL